MFNKGNELLNESKKKWEYTREEWMNRRKEKDCGLLRTRNELKER